MKTKLGTAKDTDGAVSVDETPYIDRGAVMKGMVSVLVLSMGIATAACGADDDEESDKVPKKDAALRVMVNAEGAEEVDVDGARWSVVSCDGGYEALDAKGEVDRWTHEVMTPAHIDGEGDLFMEDYLEVPAGCYDVVVTLLDSDRRPVSDCSTVRGVEVDVDGDETAEVVLFSRCDGVDDEPKVEMLRFEPTAFVECGEDIEICATVKNDGLSVGLDWRRKGDVSLAEPIQTGPIQSGDDRVVQCAQWIPKHHGETQGWLRAISGQAEVMDGGDTVLFADPHEARFSTFLECRPSQ